MRPNRPNRGFIMLAALGVLGIVGVALLALAAAMTMDGKRTLQQQRQAQLDQMLLAGATDAVEHLKKSSPKADESWTIDLPPTLVSQDASLSTHVESGDDAKVVLLVQAKLANRSAEQRLQFDRASDGWRLTSAQIPG